MSLMGINLRRVAIENRKENREENRLRQGFLSFWPFLSPSDERYISGGMDRKPTTQKFVGPRRLSLGPKNRDSRLVRTG